MRAAEKEVALLEKEVRENAGLRTEPAEEGAVLPPITIPPYNEMKKRRILFAKTKAEQGRRELAAKVADIAAQIKARQAELEAVTQGQAYHGTSFSQSRKNGNTKNNISKAEVATMAASREVSENEAESAGAVGPDGELVAFPLYDGSAEPVEWKRAFGQYCARKRKSVKATLSDEERRDKVSGTDLEAENYALLTIEHSTEKGPTNPQGWLESTRR